MSASANANAYQVYAGLNGLWNGYILELLGFTRDGVVVADKNNSTNHNTNTNNSAGGGGGNGGNRNSSSKDGNASGEQVMRKVTAASAGSLLASADYHGMEVEVVRCADVARVGLKGIVVRETRSTFTLVCDERETRNRPRRKRRKMVGGMRDGGVGFDGDRQPRVRDESHSNLASRSDSGLKSSSAAEAETASKINSRNERCQLESQTKAPNTEPAHHTPTPTRTHTHNENTQHQHQNQNSPSQPKPTNTPNSNPIPKPPPKRTHSKIRTILKTGAVFRVTILLPVPFTTNPESERDSLQEQKQYERRLVVDLHGDQLEMRPVERAVRKFKWCIGRA